MNYAELSATQKAAIAAAQAKAGRWLDFDAVRQACKPWGLTLPDGAIHQVCIDAGMSVEMVAPVFPAADETPAGQ